MLVTQSSTVNYLKDWLRGMRDLHGASGFVIPLTGGIDSTVCGALMLDIRPVCPVTFICMGFKSDAESRFEEWAKKKYGGLGSITFRRPIHPDLSSFTDSDARDFLIGTYVGIEANAYGLLAVGAITRSEYRLVKNIDRDFYDAYPFIDLYRSEVVEIGRYLEMPSELLTSQSRYEKQIGITYAELEWADRENEGFGIINSELLPTVSRYWGMYDQRRKEIVANVYNLSRQRKHIDVSEKKMCMVRKALPGALS